MKNHSERGDFFVVENTCDHFEYIRQATAKADYTALRETRKVPNYQLSTRKGGFLICIVEMLGKKKLQP